LHIKLGVASIRHKYLISKYQYSTIQRFITDFNAHTHSQSLTNPLKSALRCASWENLGFGAPCHIKSNTSTVIFFGHITCLTARIFCLHRTDGERKHLTPRHVSLQFQICIWNLWKKSYFAVTLRSWKFS